MSVVPAKVGTHMPCLIVRALEQIPSATINAGGYGYRRSPGRPAETFCVCSRRMTSLAGGVGVDIAALEQIVEASDAVPAVSVGFEQQRMLAALIGLAVVFRQQVDQKI